MKILVIGSDWSLQECQLKFGVDHEYQLVVNYIDLNVKLQSIDIVFDFLAEANQIKSYDNFQGTVFLNAAKNSLQELAGERSTSFVGFVGLPTFLDREILEVSLRAEGDQRKIESVFQLLNTRFAVVKDQTGLITARVIAMIINEAYFAVEENIASRHDIDLAMKLGTNYPFGPFEWCDKIGIGNVFQLLDAVYESSQDDRYRVCALLKAEATQPS